MHFCGFEEKFIPLAIFWFRSTIDYIWTLNRRHEIFLVFVINGYPCKQKKHANSFQTGCLKEKKDTFSARHSFSRSE